MGLECACQGWDCCWVADVAERDADVALEADALGALDGAAAKARAECCLVQVEQGYERGCGEVVALLKGGFEAAPRLAVDGADVLADVAAENPVADEAGAVRAGLRREARW